MWRLQTETGDATGIRAFGDDRIIVNLSVWESMESLGAFAFDSTHRAVLKRRREWFERMAEAYVVLWWVPAGTDPDRRRGRAAARPVAGGRSNAGGLHVPRPLPATGLQRDGDRDPRMVRARLNLIEGMDARRMGQIDVPIAGIGCNNFGRRIDEERSREVVHAALDAGSTLFDTADLYGDGRSEEFLGRALGGRRDEVVIVSKFGMREPPDGLAGGSPEWIPRACAASLERLGTDRIDVYLLHQPDDATPIADTLGAMSRLVDEGLVREIGCSNFSVAQLREAEAAAAGSGIHRFVTVQNEYSLVSLEPRDGVLAVCRDLGVSFMPYFPLASGLLTGKYERDRPPPAGTRMASGGWDEFLTGDRFAAVERLDGFARAHGHSLLELALSWLATQPEIATVIAGATSADQVRANAAATCAWRLSADELAQVDALLEPA